MRAELTRPAKLVTGDRVAVVSGSFAAPAMFPAVHELAMRRLRDDIGLQPVEYPITRKVGALPQARAADLMAAFADPEIKAILATIGGEDQISVLRWLDPELVAEHPKAFVGYSDNTNILSWCWNLGLAGYHGGSTMVHLGRAGALHRVSTRSLRAALMDGGDLVVHEVDTFSEDEVDWADRSGLVHEPLTRPHPGRRWHRPAKVITGPTWGGNLEILSWNLAAGRWIRPVDDRAGCVLLLETSEERPSAQEVFRMLRNAGERGLLAQFPAVIVGLAKAASFDEPADPTARERYRDEQPDAILREDVAPTTITRRRDQRLDHRFSP